MLIGEEDPPFAGGSYVVVQKYVHDLHAWDALPVEEQERAVGRTKLSDLELADEEKPSNSHVALTTIRDGDGTERQIGPVSHLPSAAPPPMRPPWRDPSGELVHSHRSASCARWMNTS